tara:strand:+ start:446 stop:727 length:282 start_codon:yes stop_codon:yes gene_type:complete
VEQTQDYEGWQKVDEVEDLRKRTYHFVGAGTMKVGTLVAHRKWGKAFVTEVLESEAFVPIRVRWLNPHTHPVGKKVVTSVVWQQEITIISEGE